MYRNNYFEEEGIDLQTGKKEAALVGNLCAFQFWQRMFKVYHICNNHVPCAYLQALCS